MRCAEARKRIIAGRGRVDNDPGLARHLEECDRCAAFARAEHALNHDLALADYGTDSDDMPLSAIRSRVEARERELTRKNAKEISVMSAALKQLKRRPALSFSMIFACAVLIIGTLVPFSFESTVGYEVAVAGVDRELAVDTDRVTELLSALGVQDANVTLGDCEQTCVLKISELKSEGDAKLVTTAFRELGNFECKTVAMKASGESCTLLDKAKSMIVIKRVDSFTDDSTQQIVIETIAGLDSVCGGQFNIWVSADSCAQVLGSHTIISGEGCDSAGAYMMMTAKDCAQMTYMGPDENGNMEVIDLDDPDALEKLKKLGINLESDALTAKGCRMLVTNPSCGPGGSVNPETCVNAIILNDEGDSSTLIYIDKDGVRHEIDLNDPDAEEQLAALGIEIECTESEDGTTCCTIKCGDGDGGVIQLQRPSGDADEDDVSMKETSPGELPDGFELDQNHPNPFNPTTDISFTIPEPQRVLLQVYNVRGQLVRTLIDADMSAGSHSVQWDSRDEEGQQVSSGVYFYRLTAGDMTATKKMTLVK